MKSTSHILRILVVCRANSCRSQMTQGLLQRELGDRVQVFSAGTEPGILNPDAVKFLLHFEGVDISRNSVNHVKEYDSTPFDFVITVCNSAEESCQVVQGHGERIHHYFKDPSKVTGTDFEIRTAYWHCIMEISRFCRNFAQRVAGSRLIAAEK